MIETAEQSQQIYDIWKGFLQPIVLPAVGGFLGVMLKEILDSRKSKKLYGIADAEFLCSQIDEIRELAISYWEKDSNTNSKVIEARITGMLHGCAEIIGATNLGSESDKADITDALSQFRKACTSASFGQVDRSADFTRLLEVEIEGRALYAKVLSFRRT